MDPAAATDYVLKLDAERQSAAEGESGEGTPDRRRSYEFDRQTAIIVNAQLARGMTEATSWVEGLPEGFEPAQRNSLPDPTHGVKVEV